MEHALADSAATPVVGRTPWHLWAVGIVSLLWNAFGCYIYSMTMLGDPAMLAQTPPEVRALLETAPAWSTGAWAIGVWGALAGSLLLLLRNRVAVWAFALSLAGLALTAVYEMSVAMPMNAAQTVTIWAIALFLLAYAWTMRGRGVLR